MTKQKNGFWSFIFSLLPGAGEMYMGFMKQGLSIMVIFWLLIALGSMLSMGVFLYGLPLLWFFSFFNVLNLRSLSEEEFYNKTDDYIFHLDSFITEKKDIAKKYRTIFASILIFIGLSILWNNFYSIFYRIFPGYTWLVSFIGDSIPQIVVGAVIIWVGITMIRGKKKELEKHEDA